MSIPTTAQRTLGWYFENCWLPAVRQNLSRPIANLTRHTVEEFIRFAQVDPALADITAVALDGFQKFSLQQGYAKCVAAAKRSRIAEIKRHAISDTPPALRPEPADGTLRHYAKVTYRAAFPHLSEGEFKECYRAANRYCDFLGADVAISEITPESINQFEEAHASYMRIGIVLRRLMRTFDPQKFRVRHPGSGPRSPKPFNGGNDSAFLLANVYEKKYEPTALRSRAENTKRLYRTTLLMFGRFLGRQPTLDDLNDDTVAAFAAWRLAAPLSKHSVNKDLFNLLALWRWCHRKNLVDVWPDVKMENAPRRTPIAWTESEMRRIYRTACGLKGDVGNVPACHWWPALILVALDSAERINAVFKLDWGNVDMRRKWLRFPAETRKGSRDDSAVRLRDSTIAALRKIRPKLGGELSGPVFPWPYCYSYIWRKYGQLLAAAGLPNDRKRKFHCIRKTVASHVAAAGGDATAMLRHSKREITEAYFDPRIVTRQQPVDVLFDVGDTRAEGGAA
jgi:integrase